MDDVTLHGYFRSSAAYRVRIALNLKGISYATVAHHLRKGEHRALTYRGINPQGLVPALEVGGVVLTQSLAICEYLDEVCPDPRLLPTDPVARARVRAVAQVIACDTHPLQNLKVLARLRALGIDDAGVKAWAAGVIEEGLDACESLIEGVGGPFAFGEAVTLADIVLIPQLANARRFGVTMRWPRIAGVEDACLTLPAFAAAAPERQADAE